MSSSPRKLVDAVLDSVGGDRFLFTIAGDEVPRTKPFPDPYLEAMRRLGVDAGSCVVLEDSPTGVAAGRPRAASWSRVPFAACHSKPGLDASSWRRLTELSAESLDALLIEHV